VRGGGSAGVILWCDGAHAPGENMRRDAALLAAAAADPGRPAVLRLFGFDPPGVTLGASQVAERELDLERLAALGASWASRPTGGRAIWHEQEWTFSLACRLGPGGWARTGPEAYARTGALLAGALRALGVPVELSPGSPRGVGPPRAASGPAAPCFASTARHELTLEGRKFAGIAQREAGGALLQQGSLLLGDAHLRLADVLPLGERDRARVREAMREGTAHAGRWLGPDASLGRLADALAPSLPGARRLDGEAGLGLLAPAGSAA
jgi:lipoate-protein ligase A